MKAKEYLAAIVLSVISGFVYDLITRKFPSFDILEKMLLVISENLSDYYSVILVFLIVFFLMISYYKNQESMSSVFIPSPDKPEHVRLRGFHFRFGVIWSFTYGNTLISILIDRTTGDYVYTEGPFCPGCFAEMITSSKNWIIKKREVWICPKCDKSVYRPDRFYPEEKTIVRKTIERDLGIKDFTPINGKKEPKLKDNTTYVFETK